MNRKLYWSVLINPIAIIFYSYGIRTLWQLCQYGGIRRRVPIVLGIGIAGLVWIIGWTTIYLVCKKQEADRGRKIDHRKSSVLNIIMAVEITALVICTGLYGVRIYRSSIGVDEKLSWYLEEKSNEQAKVEIEKVEETGKTLRLDNESGTMTFYLDEDNSMSLHIIDAACGSRWYAFSSSADVENKDPFAGNGGVAEGIYFVDAQNGLILLSGASADYSRMYYTENGGADFAEVLLPMEDARADLENNQYGFAFEDFDYIDVPYEEAGILYVKVGINSSDIAYAAAVFRSEDQGKTWVYDRMDEKN